MAKAATKTSRRKQPKPARSAGRWRLAWPGLERSFEAQRASGIGEERLLAYVAFACFAAFLAGLPSAIRAGAAMEAADGTVALVAGRFVAVVIFGPLFLYGLAGLFHWIAAKVFEGSGSYFDARLALFWSLVLGVPLVALQAALSYGFAATGLDGFAAWTGIGVFVVWLWIWTSLMALAEGFSRLATFGLVLLAGFCVFGLMLLSS